MRFRPLTGVFYWIEAGALRLTPDPPAGSRSWRYEDVTADRATFATFLDEAQGSGLAESIVLDIRREVGFGPDVTLSAGDRSLL